MQRTEIKYVLTPQQFNYLKAALPSLLSIDPYCQEEAGYRVSSLYFDSSDFKAYYEKVEGENDKTKWRLRQYNGDATTLRLEKKIKIGRSSNKFQHETNHPHLLQPKLLVDYQRLAFVGNGLRVTLDYNLGYCRSYTEQDIAADSSAYHRVSTLLLEVKESSDNSDTTIVHSLVTQLGLKISPFSKYAEGISLIYGL